MQNTSDLSYGLLKDEHDNNESEHQLNINKKAKPDTEEPTNYCCAPFIKHWGKFFFAIQAFTAVVQSIWTGRNIFDENKILNFGLFHLKAGPYINFASAVYSITYILGRGGRLVKKKDPPKRKSVSKLTTCLVTAICLLNASIKSTSIIASCLDSEHSFIFDIVPTIENEAISALTGLMAIIACYNIMDYYNKNKCAANTIISILVGLCTSIVFFYSMANLTYNKDLATYLIGGIIGSISSVGSFIAAYNYYVSDAINNAHTIIHTLKAMPGKNCRIITKDITALFITLFSSVAYAIFYYIYMVSIITMVPNDINNITPKDWHKLAKVSDSIRRNSGIAALVVSAANSFLSTYQIIRDFIDKPFLLFRITHTNKQGEKDMLKSACCSQQHDNDEEAKLTLNTLGLLVQLIGVFDAACGTYSGWSLTDLDEHSPALSVLAKLCMAFYFLAYVSYYVNQGSAYEATRLGHWIDTSRPCQYLFGRSRSRRPEGGRDETEMSASSRSQA